jgi:hypothetical protein
VKTTLAVLISLFFAAFAQDPPQPPPGQRQERPPENLKLLQPTEVRATMRSFRTALGVRCDFCHVQGNDASDEKPHKLTARKMIEMTRTINATFADSKTHVTCYTCHRGASEPLTEPPPGAQPGPGGPPAAPPPAQ